LENDAPLFGGVPRRPEGQQQQEATGGLVQILQLLPVLLLVLMSFFNFPGDNATGHTGGSSYFSLK